MRSEREGFDEFVPGQPWIPRRLGYSEANARASMYNGSNLVKSISGCYQWFLGCERSLRQEDLLLASS